MFIIIAHLVGERGLEPPWILLRYHLKVVRLPVSPPALNDDGLNERSNRDYTLLLPLSAIVVLNVCKVDAYRIRA